MGLFKDSIKMNHLALEFKDIEQNLSYNNYLQIKGNWYGFIQTIYSLFWQVLTAIKLISTLSHIEIGILIFINCCIQIINLVFMKKCFDLQKKISISCLLFYAIALSIGIAHLGYENPDKYTYQELMHISFNMSLVFHNISLFVKNWFFRSILLFIPIIIIPLAYEQVSGPFIPILFMSFANILLTFLLVYFDELKMMVAYDKEFKLRHQLQEWKNLIEKYIPHEIVIVSKVPLTEYQNEQGQFKQKLKNKEQINVLSTQLNQDKIQNDKLDHIIKKISQDYYSNPYKSKERNNQTAGNGNGYQINNRSSKDNVKHNGMMLFPSEQKNISQSLFPDTNQDASLSNIKELERIFDEQQRQLQNTHIQRQFQQNNTSPNELSSERGTTNQILQQKSQFNKNIATKEENNQNSNQKSFSQDNQLNRNQKQFRTKHNNADGEQNSKSNQKTDNITSQNNVFNFDNTSIIDSDTNKDNLSNYNKNNVQYQKLNSQTNQLIINNDQGQTQNFYPQQRNMSIKINGVLSQQSNTPVRGRSKLQIDAHPHSQPQSSSKLNQQQQYRDYFLKSPESMSLENNDIDIINNYKEMIKQRKLQQQQEYKQINQRHQSFNMINANKGQQWSAIVSNKKMSFNSFNQLSHQGSISININQNQLGFSQNNIESNHTRSRSLNNDNIQHQGIDAKTPNSVAAPQSYLNILPTYVLSEEVILSERNNTNGIIQKNPFKGNHYLHRNYTDDNFNQFDYPNTNKTFNIPPNFSDCDSSFERDQKQTDRFFISDGNKQISYPGSPLNKKQHFIKELMMSQDQDDEDQYQLETLANRQITNNDNLTVKDQIDPLIDHDKLDYKKYKSQPIFIRQKSQTLQGNFIGLSIVNGREEQNNKKNKNDKIEITNTNSKQQNIEKSKSNKKDPNISIQLIKQQNGIKQPIEQTQKLSISIKAEENYRLKEAPFKIIFPQINSRFAASFAKEEDEIKRRLKNIVKDNVSVYERIQEYFQNNDMNVHRSTSLQISVSHNNLNDQNKDRNQNIPNTPLQDHTKNKLKQIDDHVFKALQNKSISSSKEQQDLNKKESYFEFLGCFDSISKRYYDIKIIPVFFENKNSSLMIHFNDISDSVMNQRLQQAQKYKDLMLASISHDLRTPLNFIKLMTEKCEEEESLDVIKGLLPMIKSNCEMLMSLINDILDHQQMQEGKFRLVTSNFSINTLLDEIHQLFKIQSEEKNIQIVRKVDQNIIINSDKNRLKQILINLMSNAIKFTQKGQIKISAHLTNDCNLLALSIKDSGCGIPQNLQEKLFQVYSTFDHAEGTNKHGKIQLFLFYNFGNNEQYTPQNKIIRVVWYLIFLFSKSKLIAATKQVFFVILDVRQNQKIQEQIILQ